MSSLIRRSLTALLPLLAPKKQSGFSLIEMMSALTVIGLLGSLTLPLLRQHRNREERRLTHLHQERIFYALAAFLHTQGRLPCPADPSNPKREGVERPRCQTAETFTGLVPFRTLGLPESVAKDGRRVFFIYTVQPELTLTRNLREYCHPGVRHLLSLAEDERDPTFDPIAVSLKSPSSTMRAKKIPDTSPKSHQYHSNRWETRKNLAAFYGRLFCPAPVEGCPPLSDR